MEGIQFIDVISSIALVAVTVGLWVSTNMYRKATEEMARIQQKDADHLKRDNALKLIERWDDPALLRTRTFTRDIREKRPKISDQVLLWKTEGKPAVAGELAVEGESAVEGEQVVKGLKESLIHVFNFWESVRLSITYDRADEDILREAFESAYISMYERFEVWLNEQSPGYKEDLEKLYNRWKSAS